MTPDVDIAALVPHAGRMCLLERIGSWDGDGIVVYTTTHRDPSHPLAGPEGLRAIHLCEYGAQAMAVHGGLVAAARGERARPGMLVSLRDVVLRRRFVHDLPGELRVEAHRLQASPAAMQYMFRVLHDGSELAHGRAIVSSGPPG